MQHDEMTGVDVQPQGEAATAEDAPPKDTPIAEDMPWWVYRVNRAEWWAAMSLDQAVESASIWYGLPMEEIVDELAPPYKMTEEQMLQTFIEVNGIAIPFWFELTRLYRMGEPFPRLFGRNEE